jgi:hypothetical protein
VQYQTPTAGTVTADLGLWMFRGQDPPFGIPMERRLSFEGIAHALGQQIDGRRLLEPINVLWIDGLAGDATGAAARVSLFLRNSFFRPEPLYHTHDYYGHFPLATPPWIPPLERWSWVDDEWPSENNHGRVFASLRAVSDRNVPLFLTIGAFSREGDCGVPTGAPGCHAYLPDGFNIARDALVQHTAGGWSEHRPPLRLNNEYPPELGLPFTTERHDGVRVFESYPPMDVCSQIRNIQLISAPYGDPDKAQATFDLPASVSGGATIDFTSHAPRGATWTSFDWWRESVPRFTTTFSTPYIDKPWQTRWRLTLSCNGGLIAEREGPALTASGMRQ